MPPRPHARGGAPGGARAVRVTTTLPREHCELAEAHGLDLAAILREGIARELAEAHGIDLSAVPTPRQGRPPRSR